MASQNDKGSISETVDYLDGAPAEGEDQPWESFFGSLNKPPVPSLGIAAPSERSEVAVAPAKPGVSKMTPEQRLEVIRGLFRHYAERGVGYYIDNIERDLLNLGIRFEKDEGFFWAKDSLKEEFKVKERDRGFFFYSKADGDRPRHEPRKIKIAWALILAVLALGSILAVSIARSGFANSKSEAPAVSESLLETGDVWAGTDSAGDSPFLENDIGGQSRLLDSINRLIDSGHFAAALIALQSFEDPLDPDFPRLAKNRINLLISRKADSLSRAIRALADDRKYQEAFILEQHFDKDVFQLAGKGVAKDLRQRLIGDWVRSYKGWLSKEEAMAEVTGQVREILGSSCYRVAEGDSGEIYLEYDSGKKRSAEVKG